MADPEHVGILKQGVAAWNAWRDDNPDIRPDLCGANLGEANLINANLRGADIIEANILVPMTRLPESDDPDVETVRLPRLRAACSMYAGPMGPEFRRRHAALFAWMDARGVPRKGTAHHHAYLAGRGAVGDWTVEIRVPVVGGSAPAIPL